MKNFLKIGLCLTLAFIIASCENPTNEKPTLIDTTLEAITIKTNPTKTTYQVNEEFDPTGLVITATYTETYSNASTKTTTKDVTYNNGNMTFSGTDFSTVGTKTITVTYSEKGTTKTATLQVTVNQDEDIVDPNIFTYDDEVTIAANTYTAGTDVTIQIPATENEQPTTVNIAKLYEQYNTIAEQVGEEGSVSISYADPANTTIENETDTSFYMNNYLDTEAIGEVDQYKNIKSFINAINSSIDTTKDFPKISAKFSGRVLKLYHTGLADLFNLYCNNNMGDKLEGVSVSISNGSFDAVDYLTEKGGIAYDQNNQYTGNYYDLDVNAALLMNGVAFKNVNINGTLQKDITFGGSFTNTRFDVNSNGKVFEIGCDGTGLIEFAGDTPALTPRVDSGRLVLRNAPSKVSFQGGFSVDLSALSADDIRNSDIATDVSSFTEAIYSTEEAKNSSGFISSSVHVGDNLVEGNNYYATNQQWVEAANEGNWIEYGSKKYPNVSNLQ